MSSFIPDPYQQIKDQQLMIYLLLQKIGGSATFSQHNVDDAPPNPKIVVYQDEFYRSVNIHIVEEDRE